MIAKYKISFYNKETQSFYPFAACIRVWSASLAEMKKILSSASALEAHTPSSLTRKLTARSECWALTSSRLSSPANASERLWITKTLGLERRSLTWKEGLFLEIFYQFTIYLFKETWWRRE